MSITMIDDDYDLRMKMRTRITNKVEIEERR